MHLCLHGNHRVMLAASPCWKGTTPGTFPTSQPPEDDSLWSLMGARAVLPGAGDEMASPLVWAENTASELSLACFAAWQWFVLLDKLQ